MFYSYILRRAVQPLSDAATPAHPGNRKPAQPLDRSCVAGVDPRIPACKSDKPGEDTANRKNRFSSSVDCANDDARDNGLHPAGVGLRGLQGLRCLPPTEKNGRTGKTGRLLRRPSSAPARRQREKVASVGGRCLSPGRGQTTATESVFTGGTGDSGRRTPHAAPGVWGAEECNELWHGLVRCRACRSFFFALLAWHRKRITNKREKSPESIFQKPPSSCIICFVPSTENDIPINAVVCIIPRCDIRLDHD